jgi:hypothetical protein
MLLLIMKSMEPMLRGVSIRKRRSKMIAYIHNMGIFNRVASYHNKNTVHVDYKSTGTQGRFHDGGEGWKHIP